jgi:hypothetical protein
MKSQSALWAGADVVLHGPPVRISPPRRDHYSASVALSKERWPSYNNKFSLTSWCRSMTGRVLQLAVESHSSYFASSGASTSTARTTRWMWWMNGAPNSNRRPCVRQRTTPPQFAVAAPELWAILRCHPLGPKVEKHSVNPCLAAGPREPISGRDPQVRAQEDQICSSSPAQATTVMGKTGGVLTIASRWSLMTALLRHEPVTVWGCLSSQRP